MVQNAISIQFKSQNEYTFYIKYSTNRFDIIVEGTTFSSIKFINIINPS